MTVQEVQEAAYSAVIVKIDNMVAKAARVAEQVAETEDAGPTEEARLVRSTLDYILSRVIEQAKREGLFTEQHGDDSTIVRAYVIHGADR